MTALIKTLWSKRLVVIGPIAVYWLQSWYTSPDMAQFMAPWIVPLVGLWVGADSYTKVMELRKPSE